MSDRTFLPGRASPAPPQDLGGRKSEGFDVPWLYEAGRLFGGLLRVAVNTVIVVLVLRAMSVIP